MSNNYECSKNPKIDDSERVVSLLGKEDSKRRKKCTKTKIIVCWLTCVIALISLLCLGIYIAFADSSKPLRCFMSDRLDKGLVECDPQDKLNSLQQSESLAINTTSQTEEAWDIDLYTEDVAISLNHTRKKTSRGKRKYTKQEREWIQLAEKTWDIAWEITHDKRNWRHLSGEDKDTGRVFSKSYEDYGTVYKIQGYVDTSPENLFDIMVTKTPETPEWQPIFESVEIYSRITDNVEIIHSKQKGMAGGMIGARDTVAVGHWKSKDNATLHCSTSISHPDLPSTDDYVREETKLTLALYERMPRRPNRCLFTMAFIPPFASWMPEWLIQTVVPSVMSDMLNNVRQRAAQP